MPVSRPQPGVFLVTLTLRAPGVVAPPACEAVLTLLTGSGAAGRWTSVQAVRRDHDEGIDLLLTVSGADAATAATAMIDDVRAVVGLHGTFARWVVDARHVSVRAR